MPRPLINPMSLYSVQKLLFHLNNVAAVRERLASEPERVLDEYRLSAEERKAVREGDVGRLYVMGVHPLLLAPFGGRCGLAWPNYLAALKLARETDAKTPCR